MSYSFNLLDEAWVPVTRLDGRSEEVSLREALLGAHTLSDLAAQNPLETVGMLTLMLAVLHRVYGPANRKAWQALAQQGRFPAEPLDAYLNTWHDRFDLFDAERPFYQIEDMRFKPVSIVNLIYSSSNNAAVFSHETESIAVVTSAKAVRLLLAGRVFHLAGSKGSDYHFTDAIFARGALFFASGPTLWETLLLNLVRYPDEKVIGRSATDSPRWEREDPFEPRDFPDGYLDYLTWPNTRVKLIPNETPEGIRISKIRIGPGLVVPPVIESPMKSYRPARKAEEERKPVILTKDRALWRDYHTFLRFRNNAAQQAEGRSPIVVTWLYDLVQSGIVETRAVLQLRCMGAATDPGKSTTFFLSDKHFPLPAALLDDDELIRLVGMAVQLADALREDFRKAIWVLALELTGRGSEIKPDPANVAVAALMDQWDVETLYWSDLEAAFWHFTVTLPDDSQAAWNSWQNALRSAAIAAFEAACAQAGNSTDALRGEAGGRRILFAALKKHLQQEEQEQV